MLNFGGDGTKLLGGIYTPHAPGICATVRLYEFSVVKDQHSHKMNTLSVKKIPVIPVVT